MHRSPFMARENPEKLLTPVFSDIAFHFEFHFIFYGSKDCGLGTVVIRVANIHFCKKSHSLSLQ